MRLVSEMDSRTLRFRRLNPDEMASKSEDRELSGSIAEKYDRLQEALSGVDGPVTTIEIAGRLGVPQRTA